MTTYYFNPYQSHFSIDFDFNFVLHELADHNKLINNILAFYFPEMDEENILKCRNSIANISHRIDNSKYDESIKRKLYSLLVNPELTIQKLSYELMSKELVLSQYYEKNYSKIIQMQSEFDFDKLAEGIKDYRDIEFLKEESNKIFISSCLLNKDCICLFVKSENATILLGYDYLDSLKSLHSEKHNLSLKEFGDVITEQNRVDILDLLVERKEITIKDLEKLLDFSGSTAYYHITMMMRYNIVKSRNQGRTVFYSLNEEYFESIIQVLSKYLKKEG